MNILLLTTHLHIGGIGVYTVSLAKALKERKHQIIVASAGGDLVKELEAADILHCKVGMRTKSEVSPKVLFATGRLFKLLDDKNIEIIHAQTRVSQVVAACLSKLAGIPYVTTCHGFFKRRAGRRIFKGWGDRVIAISEAVRSHLVCEMKVDAHKVRLIPNGVDTRRFRGEGLRVTPEEIKKEFGLKNGPVIGIIARLSPVKGHAFLIAAMKEVLKERSDAQLLIVGDGPIRDQLIEETEKLGIGENVVFSESTIDTTKPLSVIDIFVLPSLQEGLGLSIMEAQACGKPVVASNTGGISTVVKDGVSGLLVPPGNSESIAKSILMLLNDRELAKRLGRNGATLIREKFSLERVVSEVEKVYREVIGERDEKTAEIEKNR